jgi:hypothetical protein
LSRGSIGFILCSKDDAWEKLSSWWYWDRNLLYAKPWHPLFYSQEEVISSMPTWIKLPNFSLEFWIDSRLKAIGEGSGNLITSDETYKTSSYKLMEIFLVDLDL